jgi:hypothetical protein
MLELLKLGFLFFSLNNQSQKKKRGGPKNTAQEVDAHFVWQQGQ